MAKEAWYINESEADDIQIQIIRKNLRSSFIVKGCAGSGKTVLALWRAAELQQNGEQDFLVIVFTKALKQFIMDGILEIGIDTSKVMYHWEWKNAGSPTAKYIIVDEAQDFDEDEIKELQEAAKEHLILFGDSAQQIYNGLSNKGRLLTMEEMQVQTGIPMENLVINHRLPKKVARLAEQISSSSDNLVDRCKKEGVDKPHLIQCVNWERQLDYIFEVIDAKGYKDVGILFPTNDEVEKAHQYLSEFSHQYEQKVRRAMNLNFRTTNPKLMTYHSAKGLQFEAVFLPNINIGENRNPLYVAMSRTYRDLFMLYSGKENPLKDIVPRHWYSMILDENNVSEKEIERFAAEAERAYEQLNNPF